MVSLLLIYLQIHTCMRYMWMRHIRSGLRIYRGHDFGLWLIVLAWRIMSRICKWMSHEPEIIFGQCACMAAIDGIGFQCTTQSDVDRLMFGVFFYCSQTSSPERSIVLYLIALYKINMNYYGKAGFPVKLAMMYSQGKRKHQSNILWIY